MIRDDDLGKWDYPAHTEAKHDLLERYLKAWLSILGRAQRRQAGRSHLMVVDAFAGRGRYARGEPGSPLIVRDVAGLVSADGRVDVVDLHCIERNSRNFESLREELQAEAPTGVIQQEPVHAAFEDAAPPIIAELRRRPRPSFWFIDPYGFGGIPLAAIRAILTLPRSEAFITLMVRDMWRFRTSPNQRRAILRTLDLEEPDLDRATASAERSGRGADVFRDLYKEALEGRGGARYIWSYRVAMTGSSETLYFLVHASNHPKAYREMKRASYEVSGGAHAFRGAGGMADMFADQWWAFVDMPRLQRFLLSRFAGRTIEYDKLFDDAQPCLNLTTTSTGTFVKRS